MSLGFKFAVNLSIFVPPSPELSIRLNACDLAEKESIFKVVVYGDSGTDGRKDLDSDMI